MRALSKLHLPAGLATRSSPQISLVALSSLDAPKGQRLGAPASLSHAHHASSLAWRASSTVASERNRFDSEEDKEVREANERCVGCVID